MVYYNYILYREERHAHRSPNGVNRIYTHHVVVWNKCRERTILYVTGERVTLGKYQQTTLNAAVHWRSLR